MAGRQGDTQPIEKKADLHASKFLCSKEEKERLKNRLYRTHNKVSKNLSESIEFHSKSYEIGVPGISRSDNNIKRSEKTLQDCRNVDNFERLSTISQGTVYSAQDKITGEIVTLKKVKLENGKEEFPLEIKILLSLNHPSIGKVKELVIGRTFDNVFMVLESIQCDLKILMDSMKRHFNQCEVRCIMLQLLQATDYLHNNSIFLTDLQTSKLLLNNHGELKILDCRYGSPLKPYTDSVATLWYRAPELLFGAKEYSTAIDMWSMGCIMAELLSKQPLFNGKTELDQLDKIFKILGTPNEMIWPGLSKLTGVQVTFVKHKFNLFREKFPATSSTGSPVLSDAGFDLLNKLLTYDPESG